MSELKALRNIMLALARYRYPKNEWEDLSDDDRSSCEVTAGEFMVMTKALHIEKIRNRRDRLNPGHRYPGGAIDPEDTVH